MGGLGDGMGNGTCQFEIGRYYFLGSSLFDDASKRREMSLGGFSVLFIVAQSLVRRPSSPVEAEENLDIKHGTAGL